MEAQNWKKLLLNLLLWVLAITAIRSSDTMPPETGQLLKSILIIVLIVWIIAIAISILLQKLINQQNETTAKIIAEAKAKLEEEEKEMDEIAMHQRYGNKTKQELKEILHELEWEEDYEEAGKLSVYIEKEFPKKENQFSSA